jgi:hypothetical protein
MASRKLMVEIIGDSASLERAFGRVGKQTETLGSKFAGMAKYAALGAGAAGIGALVVGLKGSVDAAKQAQVAQAQLEAALKSAGTSYEEHGKSIDAVIQKTSRLAGLDDEALSASFAKLVRTTGDVTKATEGMALAADIARARNIDLEAATKIVEKANEGQMRGLKMVGVEIDKNTTTTQALERAQQKFAGSAEVYGKTAAGAQDKLSVAFENLQETVGAKVLPVFQRLALKLVEMIDWSEKNWPRFREAAVATFNAIKPVIDMAVAQIQSIVKVIEGVVKIIQGIRNGDWSTVWAGIKQVVVGAVEGMVASVVRLPLMIMAALSRKAFAALEQIGGWIKDAVLDGLSGLAGAAVGMISGVINSALGLINSAISKANAAASIINKVLPGNPVGSIPSIGLIGGRASGGPVAAGVPYMVGERGPELFVPGSSGAIVPNGSKSGGVTIVLNAPNYVGDKADLIRVVRDEFAQIVRANGSLGLA